MNRLIKGTSFGNLEIVFHSDIHGGVYTKETPLTINKVEYRFQFEFVFRDGVWIEGRYDTNSCMVQEPTPYRCHTMSFRYYDISRWNDSPSHSAIKKVYELRDEIFASLNAGHYKKYAIAGKILQLKTELHNLEEQERATQKNLITIKDEIEAVKLQMTQIQ